MSEQAASGAQRPAGDPDRHALGEAARALLDGANAAAVARATQEAAVLASNENLWRLSQARRAADAEAARLLEAYIKVATKGVIKNA